MSTKQTTPEETPAEVTPEETPEETTPEETPEETEETKVGGVLAPTAERMAVLRIPADSVDVPAFDKAVRKVITAIPGAITKDRAARLAKTALGFLILDVRQTIKIPGTDLTDDFGKTAAYRDLFDGSLVELVKEKYPNTETAEIKALLTDVRQNYLRENDRRKGLGLTYQRILEDAVEAGTIPDSTIERTEDGRVVVVTRPTETVKQDDGTEVKVPVTETVKLDDGTEEVRPVETRYVSGNPDAPKEIRAAVQDAIKTKGRPKQTIPAWAGGPVSTTPPGPQPGNPINQAEKYRAAWKVLTENIEPVAFLAAAEMIAAGCTSYVDEIHANGGKASWNHQAVADVLLEAGNLLRAEATRLANNDPEKSEKLMAAVRKYRHLPADATVSPPPVVETETDDDADAAAADAAAVEAENGTTADAGSADSETTNN